MNLRRPQDCSLKVMQTPSQSISSVSVSCCLEWTVKMHVHTCWFAWDKILLLSWAYAETSLCCWDQGPAEGEQRCPDSLVLPHRLEHFQTGSRQWRPDHRPQRFCTHRDWLHQHVHWGCHSHRNNYHTFQPEALVYSRSCQTAKNSWHNTQTKSELWACSKNQ